MVRTAVSQRGGHPRGRDRDRSSLGARGTLEQHLRFALENPADQRNLLRQRYAPHKALDERPRRVQVPGQGVELIEEQTPASRNTSTSTSASLFGNFR